MEHTDDASGTLGPAGPRRALPKGRTGLLWAILDDTCQTGTSGYKYLVECQPSGARISFWVLSYGRKPEQPCQGWKSTATDVMMDGAGMEDFFPHGLTTLYDTYSAVAISAVIPTSLTG